MLRAGTVYPLKRFALKVGFLSVFGLLQWRTGVLHSLALAFVISGSLSTCLAVASRSRIFKEEKFTYWDEAVAFFGLSALAAFAAGS